MPGEARRALIVGEKRRRRALNYPPRVRSAAMAKTPGMFVVAAASLFAGVLAFSSVVSQPAASGEASDTKDALAQNFAAEHEIGRRFHIDPNDLPAPKTGPVVTNRSLILT